MANTEATKAMQEALQTAVARMNNGSGESKLGLNDLIGPLITILPKLLQNNGSGDEMLERLDTQKGDLAALRDQVQILRKQCYRMLKSQEQLLAQLHEIQRQQVAAAGAVLDLAQQMSRITFVEDTSAGEDDQERDVPPAPAIDYRADSRAGRNGNGSRQREHVGRVRP